MTLSLLTKNSKNPDKEDTPMLHHNTLSGKVELEVNNEDTMEEIKGLVKEVEAAMAELPNELQHIKLVAKPLLKVRSFIAKVNNIIFGFSP